jgi:hypothetical protein
MEGGREEERESEREREGETNLTINNLQVLVLPE